MATTKKEAAPAKERSGRRSLMTHTAPQNPRARTTKTTPPSSSERDAKPTPNYLKPTFSSSPDAAKLAKAPPSTTRAPQRGITAKTKPAPQRSSSFGGHHPRPGGKAPASCLSSRASFSDRTSKGKATHPSLSAESPRKGKPVVGSRSAKGSCPSSANTSGHTSPKGTEDTLSNEDKEAALDILNLDAEEHVLYEMIPPALDPMTHEEELTAFVEQELAAQKVDGGNHEEADGREEGREEEEPPEEKGLEGVPVVEAVEEVGAEETGEVGEGNGVVEGSGTEVALGVDGGGERVKLRVSGVDEEEEEAAAAAGKERRKEVAQQQQQGKKEAGAPYNDVIKETASKLAETRKSKVLALAGAFETVISLDSGGPAQ